MSTSTQSSIRPLPLAAALAIMLGITAWPSALADGEGRPDQVAAVLLFMSMSAGFVSGVGFRPRFALWRALFSPLACFLGIALSLARLLTG